MKSLRYKLPKNMVSVPWRKFYIVSRPNPGNLGMYAATIALGIGFITDSFTHTKVTDAIPEPLHIAWELMMLMGGAMAIIGSGWSNITRGLWMEGWGAFICAMGLLTYSSAVAEVSSYTQPGAWAVALFGWGCLGRAWQCRYELKRLPVIMKRTAEIMRRFDETIASKGGDINEPRDN